MGLQCAEDHSVAHPAYKSSVYLPQTACTFLQRANKTGEKVFVTT